MSRVARPSGASYDRAMRYRDALPQLNGNVLLTDGGMETTLIFLDGFELPCFASFPLLERDDGRAAMHGYFEPYLEVARRHGVGFVLEANTWRANPAWGAQLGYSLDDLAEANRRAVGFVAEIREREEAPGRPIVLSAPIGPEGDAYDPESRLTADEAEAFHSWQAGVLAETAADIITALTITYVEEAIGIVRAATKHGLPVAVSFTVETDGRLPTGQASPRRSSRSMPRRTGRRPTSWSTAPTRRTSSPCSTARGRGTACSASGRTRRRRATPSSTSRRSSTTAIRSSSPRSTSRSASGSRT